MTDAGRGAGGDRGEAAADAPRGAVASHHRGATGRVALVTGSSRGLGRAIALAFARDGASVGVCCRTAAAEERAEGVCREARAFGVRAEPFVGDLSSRAEVKALFADVGSRFPGLDVLVLNAARAPFKPLERLLDRDLEALVGTNFVGQIACVREALPMLAERRGAIVFVSSLGSRTALPSYPLGTMKAAMEAAVRDLGESLRERGVAVNGVCAGLVRTDSFKTLRLAWPGVEELPEALIVTEQEVADVVLFLCSPAARGIRGQTVVVDRGLGNRLLR